MSAAGTTLRTAAILLGGSIGVIALGVQSALYGGLERAGRIDVGEIGLAASLEMVALAIGVLLAGRLAQRLPIIVVGAAGAAMLMLANAAMPFQSGHGIVVLRVIAGLAGGLLVWIANAYIVQSHRVVQLAALFLILQTALQFSAAAGAAAFAADNPDALSLIMAGCGAIGLLLAPAARGFSVVSGDEGEQPQGRLGGNALMALALMALLQFSLVGGWILIELVGGAARLTSATIAAATPLMLAAQVAGGVAAMALSSRISWSTAIAAVAVVLAGVQGLLASSSSALQFLGMAFAYGLLWNFSLPQLTPMGLAADPTMRAARVGPAAVVAGAAAGPLASAVLADRLSPSAATAAFVIPSLAVCVLALALRRRLGQIERAAKQ